MCTTMRACENAGDATVCLTPNIIQLKKVRVTMRSVREDVSFLQGGSKYILERKRVSRTVLGYIAIVLA